MNFKSKIHLNGGFTLLELLIAIALMSAIVTALYGTFIPVLNSQQRVEAELERTRALRRFMDIFTIEVHSSFFKISNPRTAFAGNIRDSFGRPMSQVTFTTMTFPAMRQGTPTGDLMVVRYSAEESPTGELNVYKSRWNPYKENEDEAFKAVVMEDVGGFEVSYFNGEDWTKAWDSRLEKRPPLAVKVKLTLKDGATEEEFSAIAATSIRNGS